MIFSFGKNLSRNEISSSGLVSRAPEAGVVDSREANFAIFRLKMEIFISIWKPQGRLGGGVMAKSLSK